MRYKVLIIDPQNDFCDPTGNLFVRGADADMKRLSTAINEISDDITTIHVSMDTHHLFDITHPVFWWDCNGVNPKPNTLITYEDVMARRWMPVNPWMEERAVYYLVETFPTPLCIFEPHCLIGSPGSNIYPILQDTLLRWEVKNNSPINHIYKGYDIYEEQFSIFSHREDSDIKLSSKLVCREDEWLLVAGEARSHCVAASIRDLVSLIGIREAKKIVLLEDCMSDVPGFETDGEQFMTDMIKSGVSVIKSTDL
jgi:nicotinamidase/pyrazinamidase